MVQNWKKLKFATFPELEKYFETKILLKKNISSKVIGKTIYLWNKSAEPRNVLTNKQILEKLGWE